MTPRPARHSASTGRGRLLVLALILIAGVAVLVASAPLVVLPAPVPAAVAASGGGGGHRASNWTITALGDSVTAGTACDCAPFVDTYATLTEQATGVHVSTHNLGLPGETAGDLVASLASDADVTTPVSSSDIVLVTIGANDLADDLDQWNDGNCDLSCFQTAMPDIQTDLAAIVNRIHVLRAGRPTEILVTDYWNVFRDGDVAAQLGTSYATISDEVTKLANTAICAGARSSGATCVDLYVPFKGDGSSNPTALLADDGDHPDAAGHQLIADALATHGWQELLA